VVSSTRPLVSIFMFVRNGSASVRRAVQSVRAQTYPNIEFVVQDGASTDDTVEIVREYGEDVKIVSEPDSGTNQGLWRAITRCTGEFVGSCLADEELLPDAVERAVALLQANPRVGAITGDSFLTDLAGNETGFWRSSSFNLIDYLFCDYTPYFVASFFRRSCLVDAGVLPNASWSMKCAEFQLWCQLASVHRIVYVPQTFSKYGAHPGQASSTPKDVLIHFTGRMEEITRLCAGSPLVSGEPRLRTLAIWGQARNFINHSLSQGLDETAADLFRIAREAAAERPAPEIEGVPYDEHFGTRRTARAAWNALQSRIPALGLRLAGPDALDVWRRKFEARLIAASYHAPEGEVSPWKALWAASSRAPAASPPFGIMLPPPPSLRVKAELYARLAMGYAAQGRFEEAAETWVETARLFDLVDANLFPPVPPPKYTGKS
jgi:glycosyltransferase involved in cell wall biosynthesis